MPPNSDTAPQPTDTLGDYELHIAWEGFASIRQRSSGEIMHSRSAPMDEARQLYVDQSRLAGRLTGSNDQTPLVLWDVGLGAAANAMAAIECYRTKTRKRSTRPLRIVSFENDLDSFRLAARHADRFSYLNDEAPAKLLASGRWQAGPNDDLSWILIQGDFTETMRGVPEQPDLIFYDMFSSRCSPEAWAYRTFAQLATTCGDRATELFTYTRSTTNRAALLAAGFHVARGRPFGKKEETTIALSPAAAAKNHNYDFLAREWLEKWKRSAAPFPHDICAEEKEAFTDRLLSHPQFDLPRTR